MKLLHKSARPLWLAAAMGIMIAICFADEPIENLRVRLEYYPTGEVKTDLFAKRAIVPEDGSIVAYGVVLKEFDIEGNVKIQINADDTVFSQDHQSASSTNHVSLKRGDIKVSGTGYDWNGTDKKLKILKRAKVVFPAAIIKEEGVLNNVKKK